MKPMNQSKTIVRGALTLTVAALIIKILSAIYRVPFQNIVGDVGYYIYQQVYPLYGIAVVLATYGFPVVISKLYIEQKSRNDEVGIKRLLVVSTIFLSLLGIVGFCLLYFGSDLLAAKMNDVSLALLIKVVAIVFLFIPFIAVPRGYFQGRGNMVPTAISQVGEQFVRVGTILVAALFLMNTQADLYVVGAGAIFGSVTGGLVAIIILLAFMWGRRERTKAIKINFHQLFNFKEVRSVVKVLVIQGLAVCLSSMLLIFIQLADSLNLYALLVTNGINGEVAKGLKGVYDRGQPLIQLGSVVATSLSLALVPLIASDKLRGDSLALQGKINLSLRISVAIGLGATVGLSMIMKPTNMMLFKNTEGSEILALLSVIILFSSIILTAMAVLQGLGKTMFPALIVFVGFGLKVGINSLLVPHFNTLGAALASNLSLLIVLLLLLLKLSIVVKKPLFSANFILKTVVAAISMALVLKLFLGATDFIYGMGNERLAASIQALSAVVLGGFTYLFVLIRGKSFTVAELTLLPFGSKIIKLFSNQKKG